MPRASKGLLAALSALCWIVVVAFTPGASAAPEGLVDMASPHDFKTLVERLDKAVKDGGMFVVTRASASAGAKGRGLTIPGDMVVGVYRNDFAVRMLEASVPSGIEAPIRFHLYETADGKARLAYRTPSAVFGPYDGGAALKEMAAELDAIFAKIAKDAIAP